MLEETTSNKAKGNIIDTAGKWKAATASTTAIKRIVLFTQILIKILTCIPY